MEKPNEYFFPEQEKSVFSLEKVSLNKVNTNTPFLISPNIAERTYIFEQKVKEQEKKTKPGKNYQIDWQKEYDDKSIFFMPENRWTHEVVRYPELIKNNKYKIYLDADVKVQSSKDGLQLVTRTLLPYVEINKDLDNSLLDFYESNKNDYVPFFYSWILRWTPRSDYRLLFYSDEEMENQTFTKVPKFTVDYKKNMPNIKIPFFLSKKFFPKKTLIPHDSAIMYLEIFEEG